MVAVVAVIGETFLQSGSQMLSPTALRLPKSLFGLAQFVGMSNLLASGEGQEGAEARVNAYSAIAHMRDDVGLRVDKEAEIPARRPFDDASTFEPSCREVLRMKPHVTDAWNVETCAIGSLERIRKRDARQLVPLAFEPWLLRQLLIAPLPGCMRHVEYALQGVAGDVELFAVIGQQIVERFWAVIDAVFGILFNLADRPIPDTSELEEPRIELPFLGRIETKFQLPLDHLILVSGSRCTV